MPMMAIRSVDFEIPAVCSMPTAPITQERWEAAMPTAPESNLRQHERAHGRWLGKQYSGAARSAVQFASADDGEGNCRIRPPTCLRPPLSSSQFFALTQA